MTVIQILFHFKTFQDSCNYFVYILYNKFIDYILKYHIDIPDTHTHTQIRFNDLCSHNEFFFHNETIPLDLSNDNTIIITILLIFLGNIVKYEMFCHLCFILLLLS